MGGHNIQVFLAIAMHITFECPAFVVLRGDTLEWISAPRRLPSVQAVFKLDIQKRYELFGVFAS